MKLFESIGKRRKKKEEEGRRGIFILILFSLLIPSSSSFLPLLPSAQAAQYDIKQMTPEIKTALANRQARYETLQSLKNAGALGENNSGYVEALNEEGGAVELANAENSDRRVIYEAIVEQNGLGSAGLGQVQKVFAEVQRDKARSGDKIQLPSGEWGTK